MRTQITTACLAIAAVAGLARPIASPADQPQPQPQPQAQEVPRAWVDSEMASLELPLATPEHSPEHVPQEYYDALPERVIWKSYPIYHPDREPDGYREGLARLEPEVAFDASALESDRDWVEAGALVFGAPIAYDQAVRPRDVLDPAWYEDNRVAVTTDGIFPWARWVVREKGTLEVGNLSCAMCHTRLMPDGSVIEGAQGNFPFEWVTAWRIRQGDTPPAVVRTFSRVLAATPWIDAPMRDPEEIFETPLEDLARIRAAVPPGVLVRQGTAFDSPARIPDLIGIQDRKYLDATGLVVHEGPGDLMRYAAVNQVLDILARYGDYVPATGTSERPPPGQGRISGTADRYSDAQLHALTRYLYSLEPPANPNPMDDRARRGAEIFQAEGCATCHTPPLYTNNRLVPAPGFVPPAEHYRRYDVSRLRVDTDPTLAMTTRRGTGYYKVPSLKGVWYRGPLQHGGAVATLEDWFDPDRLRDDYVPTGFAGVEGGPRAVEGHPFGLDLSEADRRALVAFLRTL